jgi:quinolinate synthase
MITDILYKKVSRVIPEIEWPFHADYIHEINKLKKEKNAIILAHNYQTPEIFHCVADVMGDSLKLAREAKNTDADIIVMAGVNFMAETAKIMNPSKTVLIPDPLAGCSLSDSITGRDVRLIKEMNPGIPVVTYVNTSADVKAESDICCTSSNALEIVESLGTDKVIFLPDEYLAKNVAVHTDVKIIMWHGKCMVHEKFTAKQIREYREANPGITILAHPECSPEVIAEVDYAGSTTKMSNYVQEKQPAKVLMVTECSMSDNVSVENPNVEFIRPCNLCPHMKRINLPKILESLMLNIHEVKINKDILEKARLPIERMLNDYR